MPIKSRRNWMKSNEIQIKTYWNDAVSVIVVRWTSARQTQILYILSKILGKNGSIISMTLTLIGWSIKAWTNFGRTEKWLLIKLNSTISMSFRSLTVFFYIQHRKTLPARIKCSLFMFFFIRGAIKGGLLTRSTKKTFIIPFSLLVPLNIEQC